MMNSPNVPKTDLQTPPNADKASNPSAGPVSPKSPYERACEHLKSSGGGHGTSDFDMQERTPGLQGELSASDGTAAGHDHDHLDPRSDRAASPYQPPGSGGKTTSGSGSGVGLGVGTGEEVEAGARGTKSAQRPGIDRKDSLKRGSVSSGEEGKSGGGKWGNAWSGSNSSDNSDEDGIGSETLVVDITDSLAEIGEVSWGFSRD